MTSAVQLAAGSYDNITSVMRISRQGGVSSMCVHVDVCECVLDKQYQRDINLLFKSQSSYD